MNKKIFLLISLLVIYGCQNSEFDTTSKDMDWLYRANPIDDFEKAVKHNDYRFVGIYGYSITVPGIPLKCLNIKKDVKPIEGTSDSSSSYEERKFNAIARVYADDYNFQLLKYLEGEKLFICNE